MNKRCLSISLVFSLTDVQLIINKVSVQQGINCDCQLLAHSLKKTFLCYLCMTINLNIKWHIIVWPSANPTAQPARLEENYWRCFLWLTQKNVWKINTEVGFCLTKANRDVLHFPSNSQSWCLEEREDNLPGVHIVFAELQKHRNGKRKLLKCQGRK